VCAPEDVPAGVAGAAGADVDGAAARGERGSDGTVVAVLAGALRCVEQAAKASATDEATATAF
jgi:hypothetical protein